MKRSMMMLILAGTLFTLLVAGGTMAWFTDKAEANNNFTAGTVDITVNEHGFLDKTNWNPGDTTDKEVSVTSNGSKQTYVRVSLTPEWTSATGSASLLANNVILNKVNIPDDWVLLNGWYYYKHVLSPTVPETSLLLDSVTLDGLLTDNTYQGATLAIKVKAEAVQASHEATIDAWGSSPTALGLDPYVAPTP